MHRKDAKQLKVEKARLEYSARLGATFRAFEAACMGVPLVGNFYELPLNERLSIEAQAAAAKNKLLFV